jgi:hypothetical protein
MRTDKARSGCTFRPILGRVSFVPLANVARTGRKQHTNVSRIGQEGRRSVMSEGIDEGEGRTGRRPSCSA